MSDRLQVHSIVSPPFAENTFVVWRRDGKQALLIDPGFDPKSICNFLNGQHLTPVAILNTHGHADHIGGNAAMKQLFPELPIIIGANESEMLTDPNLNLSAPFGMPVVSPPADRTVVEGDVLDLAGIRLEVFDVPGHSPGHVVYLYRGTPHQLFSGDVLFSGSIGRDDFPGGDGNLLRSGIRQKLFHLPADTIVYPGHGPNTTIGEERRSNPYVGERF